jgi:hypothetical protein
VDQAEPPEASDASAEPPDVGEAQVGRVADDDVADRAVSPDQDADLAADLPRDLGEMPRQLRRDELAGRDAAAVGSLEGPPQGGLDAEEVAVDVRYRGTPVNGTDEWPSAGWNTPPF